MSDAGSECEDDWGGSLLDFNAVTEQFDGGNTHSPVSSPVTQTPSTSSAASSSVHSNMSEVHADGDQPDLPAHYHATAEHMFQLQCKEERLQKLLAHMQASLYFDDDDAASVTRELELVRDKLEHVRSSVRELHGVFMLVTLKHREAALERAVREGMLDAQHDKSLFYTLVRKQVYLTRLASDRCNTTVL